MLFKVGTAAAMSYWTSVAHILFNNIKLCLSLIVYHFGQREKLRRNECIRGTAQVELCGDRFREVRLGYLDIWYSGYIEQMMLNVELPGRRKR